MQRTIDVTEPVEVWFALPHHNNLSMQAWANLTNLDIGRGLDLIDHTPQWGMYGVIGRLDQRRYHTFNRVVQLGGNEIVFNGTRTIPVARN